MSKKKKHEPLPGSIPLDLSDEQIEAIEQHAALLFSPKEIAVIMDIDTELLQIVLRSDNNISRAYYRGKLMREARVRKSILDLAESGSSPAQTLAMELMKDAATKEFS